MLKMKIEDKSIVIENGKESIEVDGLEFLCLMGKNRKKLQRLAIEIFESIYFHKGSYEGGFCNPFFEKREKGIGGRVLVADGLVETIGLNRGGSCCESGFETDTEQNIDNLECYRAEEKQIG